VHVVGRVTRVDALFVVVNNVGTANLAVSKKVLDYIVRIFPISKFSCE